jgi:hypothetical protein
MLLSSHPPPGMRDSAQLRAEGVPWVGLQSVHYADRMHLLPACSQEQDPDSQAACCCCLGIPRALRRLLRLVSNVPAATLSGMHIAYLSLCTVGDNECSSALIAAARAHPGFSIIAGRTTPCSSQSLHHSSTACQQSCAEVPARAASEAKQQTAVIQSPCPMHQSQSQSRRRQCFCQSPGGRSEDGDGIRHWHGYEHIAPIGLRMAGS